MSDKPELPEPLAYALIRDGVMINSSRYAGNIGAHATEQVFTADQLRAYGAACAAAAMERAAQIANAEMLNDPNTESEGDIAYDLAIKHVLYAIQEEAAAIRAALQE